MRRRHARRLGRATILALAGVVALTAASARAQTGVTLEPVVVSATRIPTPLLETPLSATVITREEIDARRPASTVDLLRQIPGLHIDQPGGRGSVSSVYIRGSDPNFALVLIDGVKVNDPTNNRGGSFDFSSLDPGSIERVEVIRGPLSAIYGSDAMGGVINIVTRGGTAQPAFAAEGGVGRYGYYRAALEARGPLGPGNFAVAAAYVDDGEPVEGSAFIGTSVNASVYVPPSETTWLRFAARFADTHSEAFPEDSGGPEFAVRRDVDDGDGQELTAAVEFGHRIVPGWEYSLRAGYTDRREDFSSPGVAPGLRDPFGIPPNASDTTFYRTSLVANTLVTVTEAVQVTLGLNAEFESGSSDGALFPGGAPIPTRFRLDRALYAPFLEALYASRFGLTVHGGLRIDYPDDFDHEVSPWVGALYRIDTTGTSIKANWGQGFKLPSFFALGNPIVGNPDLTPETSESVDLGVAQDLWGGRATLSATLFHSRFFDLIDLDEGPPPRLVNRSEVTARGVELGLDVRPTDTLDITGHLTFTETDITGTDEELRNRPRWRGGLHTRWRPATNVLLYLGVLYVGEVLDSSIPTGDRTLGDYVRVDVAATWTPHPNWRLSLTVDNLFDADYEEAVGFPAPGITPRIAAQFSF
jgi:outer membrane cobalamin receptor